MKNGKLKVKPIAFLFLPALLLGLVSCNKQSSNETPLPTATQIATTGSLPRWSPDGLKLAFGGTDTNAGLWIWNSQTGSATRIVDESHPHNYDYRWSPGSDKIAFSVPGAVIDSICGLYTVNADGSELTRRHPSGEYPDWILDGSGLIFAEDDMQSGLKGIFRLAFDTGQTTRLTDTGIEPQVSPAGTTVAFLDPVVGVGVPLDRLKIVPLSGGATTQLADTCVHFVWTADAAHLVYDYTKGGGFDPGYRICSVTVASGLKVKIVQGGAQPSVSAFGRVAHLQISGDLGQGIFVINLDGSGFEQLTLQGAQPSIKPDGSQVALSNGAGIWLVNP